MAGVAVLLCALAGFATSPTGSRILFPGDSNVPASVQEFAWRVIQTQCRYQRLELEERSYWAYRVETRRVGAGVAYEIHVLSDVAWKKTEPSAFIDMTVVDDGSLRLAGLTSKFAVCASG